MLSRLPTKAMTRMVTSGRGIRWRRSRARRGALCAVGENPHIPDNYCAKEFVARFDDHTASVDALMSLLYMM